MCLSTATINPNKKLKTQTCSKNFKFITTVYPIDQSTFKHIILIQKYKQQQFKIKT